MAGRIPQAFIDDLIARVDIVDLIDSKVPLKASGRNHVARCPFHEEKTPSFTVSRDKQMYHCFGCGAGGTAIGFLMDYDHLEFVEAVEDLARFAGVEVPRTEHGRNFAESSARLDKLVELHQQVAAFYAEALFHRDLGKHAVRYLKRRGVSGAIARHFLLGFAPPPGRALCGRFQNEGLREAGLLVDKEGRQSYDRFRNRIIFPIRDRRGRVVGFGGRVLDDSLPKYLNSPETPLFQKSKQLYGLYELLSERSRPDRILVVEGYLDVIALAQNGVQNVVATLGTAVSQNHLEMLFRFSRELVFCFDGDTAGKHAAWRAVEIAMPVLKEGRTLRIMLLPEDQDPDSMIRRFGRETFERAIAASTPLSDYFFDYLTADLNLQQMEDRANLVAKARPLIGRLPSGVFRDMMDARLGELARIENVEIVDDRRSPNRKKPSEPAIRATKNSSPLRIAISLLIQHPSLASLVEPQDLHLQEVPEVGIKLLAKVVEMIGRHPQITPGGLLERFRGEPEEKALHSLAQRELIVPEDGIEAEFKGALARILEQEREKRIMFLLEKADRISLSPEEREELLELLPSWGGTSKG